MRRNNSIRKISVFALLLITSGPVWAQSQNAFTVKQAVEYAMKNAFEVKNALIDIQVQKQTNREFTANAFPQLNGSIGVTRYFDIPVQSLPDFISPSVYNVLVDQGVKDGSGNPITFPNGGFGTIPAKFGTPWTASGGLEFSQLLFDGQVFIGLQARSAALKLATANAEITKEQIKANVYKVYYQLVVGHKQVSSIDANIERFEKLLKDTKEIFANGFAERLDVEKVEVQLNNLKTEKVKIENQLDAGNAGLKFLMGMPQKEILVLTDSISEEELKSTSLEDSVAYNNRKEYQLLTTALQLNQYNIKRYQLSKLPSIAAFASFSKNAQRSEFNFFNDGQWFSTTLAGIKMTIPLFDGNARNARIRSAKYELAKTKNNMEQLKQAIDYDVSNARIKMKSALTTIQTQKENTLLAEKVYNSTKLKYEQGLGSNQEIYNAQTELKVAQNNYYSALYDAIIAKIDYLKASGKL